jgi:hypothetical protein
LNLTAFDRVVLVYGIAWRPTQLIDATKLLPLVTDKANPFSVVVDSLERLAAADLITIRRTKSGVRFKRTTLGVIIGGRLLRDGRLSFTAAVSEHRRGSTTDS